MFTRNRPARLLFLVLLCSSLGFVGACSSEEEEVIPAGTIGSTCEGGDCAEGLTCHLGVPGGYCTVACEEECEAGSVCASMGGEDYCLLRCAGPGDCREGFSCIHGVCRLECEETTDCLEGDSCQGGVCVTNGVGAPCGHGTDCQPGMTCHRALPDGYCTFPCAEEPCPSGTTCVTFGGDSYCFVDCDDDEECRDGYICNAGVCNLPCSDDAECGGGHECVNGRCEGVGVGDPCGTGTDCEGALSCYRGVDDGYCTSVCREDADCPVGSGCGSMKGNLWCLAKCRADIDCRDGMSCIEGLCTIPCGSDDDCVEGFCDLESGRCLGGGLEIVDLGDHHPGSTVEFEVDPGVHAFSVLVHGHPSVTYASTSLINPEGTNLIGPMTQVGWSGPPLRVYASPEVFTLQMPNSDSPELEIMPGTWQMRVDASAHAAPASVRVMFRRTADGEDRDGTIPIVAHVAPGGLGDGIDASNAADSQYALAVFSRFRHYFEFQAGVEIESLEFRDMPSSYSSLNSEAEYREMFRNFSEPDVLNLFFIRSISLGGNSSVLGVSGGIPGPPRTAGTGNSGGTLQYMSNARYVGDGISHEAGHFMGLFHTSEQYPGLHDLISDTPECANPRNPQSCPDARNLMFYSLTGMMDIVTQGQAKVLRAFGGVN